jgi:YggT family protein
MDAFSGALIDLVQTVIWIFIYLLLAHIILGWLIYFNIVNARQPFVHTVGRFLYQITQPVLRPIQRVIPTFGGIDISPLVLILLLGFVSNLLGRLSI